MFIVFEGLENSGKTTQARILYESLQAKGVSCVLTRDPGGADSSRPIRDMLLNPKMDIGERAELLCYMAARVELVEKIIRPALDRGDVVICDRFVDSTLAYQGYGNHYADEQVLEFIKQSHDLFTSGLWPDVTILLEIDLEDSLERFDGARDRVESRDSHYFMRVKQGYYLLSGEESRFRVVPGNAPIEIVSMGVWNVVLPYLEEVLM